MVLTTSSVRAARYEESMAPAWDGLVDQSVNGTFMHSRRFLSYHPPNRFRDHSLALLDGANRLCGLFPAAEVDRDGLRILQSHPGASYGGLVVQEGLAAAQLDDMVQAVVCHARESGFQGIRLRSTETVFHRRRFEELDAACFRAGFVVEARELSSAVRLSGASRDDLLARWSEMGRRNVRKAERSGVVVRISDDFESYWRLLIANLAGKHETKPTHTLAEIRRLRELLGERVELIAAFHEGRMISGTVLFQMNGVAGHTMYMAQDYEFQQLRSLNLVLLHAAEVCRCRHLQWLNYGISSEPGTRGLELNHGLFAFKQSCGGEGVVRDSHFLSL